MTIRHRTRTARRKLVAESLEDRFLMAADAWVAGPHDVTTDSYQLTDVLVETGSGSNLFRSEVMGEVYHPSDLSQGPFPLVMMLHGRSSVQTSYQGYSYLGEHLASRGHIVVSISSNDINQGAESSFPDFGIQARANLIDHHLGKWEDWNIADGVDAGFSDDRFVDTIDFGRIALVGHSRGGEAVVMHANQSAFDIGAVMAIAPTNFTNQVVEDQPLGVLLPYIDGDVFPLDGANTFDNSRYLTQADEQPSHQFMVMGANHNNFNSNWTSDDWGFLDPSGVDPWATPTNRLSATEQREVATTYVTAFTERYLNSSTEFSALLRGDEYAPVHTDEIFVAYHAPDGNRLDINTYQLDTNRDFIYDDADNDGIHDALESNLLGGAVTVSHSEAIVCGAVSIPCLHQQNTGNVPFPHIDSLRGGQVAWSWDLGIYGPLPNARIRHDFNADFSEFTTLQFRIAVDHTDPLNVATGHSLLETHNIYVALQDSAGVLTRVPINNWTDAVYEPPGEIAPHAVLNTIRIPLYAFANTLEMDFQNISSMSLEVSSVSGAVLVSDIAVTKDDVHARNVDEVFGLQAASSGYFENWGGAGEKWLLGDSLSTANSWYFILPDGSLHKWYGGAFGNNYKDVSVRVAQLEEIRSDAPSTLLYAHDMESDVTQVQLETIDQELALTSSNGNYSLNWGGNEEKWISGIQSNFANVHYFVTPEGDLYKWHGSTSSEMDINPFAVSTWVASVGMDQYAFVPALHEAYDITQFSSLAQGLNNSLNLYAANSESYNWGGQQEKWFLGDVGGSANAAYFITPNGNVYKWLGSTSSEMQNDLDAVSVLLGNVGTGAYSNLSLLLNA